MKTCLLTGASGAVARALGQRLRRSGHRLALVTRHPESVAGEPDDCIIAADVATESGAESALIQAEAAFGGPPDAVVNCAGTILIAPIARTTEAQYRACLSANLDTAFFIAKAYAPRLQKADRPGALVLFSSVAASIGIGNHAAIAVAKAGVEALVRSLAADFSGIGLRVNGIAPGLLRGPATERMLNSEAAARAIAGQYPLGRIGEADEAAALAEFLIADGTWMTGRTLALDGGFGAVRPYLKVGG